MTAQIIYENEDGARVSEGALEFAANTPLNNAEKRMEAKVTYGIRADGQLWERVAESAEVSETEEDPDSPDNFDEDAADDARYESRYGGE